MRVLVAGATGVIGRPLTRRLQAAGHDVVGLTRHPDGARRLRDGGVEGVVADVLDRGGLLRALDGLRADAVVHEGTALSRAPMRHRDLYPTDRLRTRGTANLLAAARQVGARRFVTQSFLYVYGFTDHGERPVSEDAPLGPAGGARFDVHVAAMRANERHVLTAPGLEGVALRYGFFYGPEPGTYGLLDMAARRVLPAPRVGTWMSALHVEDAAAATVAALERGRPGRAYNVADDHPLTWTAYLDALAEAAGAPRPWRVPDAALRLSPYLGGLMTRASIRLDTSKAKRELGWAPSYRSVREGLPSVGTAWRESRR
ncbi:NAD-dependent epimerase/dehydratase family protein [Georgenia thermotolerans]|uniref:NAD-dependent epimerase/dehydratase family protein n=1 Tax=Georgenia thermotolerans TaxID=527326 RepID=A0A7J5UUX1_9MICO|nr:NAD(P)-dependent oxidoreductase [Georgenia thermotolerans]KAE8766072.1 NAD-dependent epimerase/dehydratase family protein [Georgenia thermotolerans]